MFDSNVYELISYNFLLTAKKFTAWLYSIPDSMDMNFCKLQETMKDRKTWRAAVCVLCLALQSTGSQSIGHNLAPEQQAIYWK